MRSPLIVRLLASLLCGLVLLWSVAVVGGVTFLGLAYLLYRWFGDVNLTAPIALAVSVLVSCCLVSRLRLDD